MQTLSDALRTRSGRGGLGEADALNMAKTG
jgi:hypothetical protein